MSYHDKIAASKHAFSSIRRVARRIIEMALEQRRTGNSVVTICRGIQAALVAADLDVQFCSNFFNFKAFFQTIKKAYLMKSLPTLQV
ncbi:MAG: hypothetical protein ABL861_08320 [Nitrosomonas sp.]